MDILAWPWKWIAFAIFAGIPLTFAVYAISKEILGAVVRRIQNRKVKHEDIQ